MAFWTVPLPGLMQSGEETESNITYIGARTGTTSASQTISAVDIGAPDVDRVVAIVLATFTSDSFSDLAVTIGGVAATVHSFTSGGVSKSVGAIAYAPIPAGATADVAISFSGSVPDAIEIGVFRVITPNPAPSDVELIAGGTAVTKTMTLTGGSVGIFATGSGGNAAIATLVNATETDRLNYPTRSRAQYCGVIDNPAVAYSVTLTVSITWALIGVCWN